MRSLAGTHHPLADPATQLKALNELPLPRFHERAGGELRPAGLEVLQVNLGRQCNQTCAHCHVDAGPDRKERMPRGVMEDCLRVLRDHPIGTLDITGGAPEMHPDFRWFVEQAGALGKHIMVRCNLTIILANRRYADLPVFYAAHKVQVISSLPFFTAERTDRQRGEGVFERSINALRLLNEQGYGAEPGDLQLDLVYNPLGAFLPGDQNELQRQYKKVLWEKHGIRFNNLYAITNMPISRFLEFLQRSGNQAAYMDRLVQAFNPAAVPGVMCRTMLSVGYDGRLFDCDFNQMLDLEVGDAPSHIGQFKLDAVLNRRIRVDQHCYGCTAGSGSSCGGAVA